MGKTRLLVISFAALFTQGCFPGWLFAMVVAPGLANRPEVCESCKEESARADHLAEAIPAWMEESRALAGPTATADRTGHFSWEISLDGQPISKCGARAGVGWQCEPLLGTPGLAPL